MAYNDTDQSTKNSMIRLIQVIRGLSQKTLRSAMSSIDRIKQDDA